MRDMAHGPEAHLTYRKNAHIGQIIRKMFLLLTRPQRTITQYLLDAEEIL